MGALLMGGCAGLMRPSEEQLEAERRTLEAQAAAESHAAFREVEGWKRKVYRNDELLQDESAGKLHLQVSLREQRGFVMRGDLVAVEFPIATGKRGYSTPTGRYTVIDKKLQHSSNLYGSVYDGEGNKLATENRSAVPEGGRFVGASMPYWMRLTNTGIGFHVGNVPGHPASHGCLRMTREAAPVVYGNTPVGTPVFIGQDAPVPMVVALGEKEPEAVAVAEGGSAM
jgi:hypothetical protein